MKGFLKSLPHILLFLLLYGSAAAQSFFKSASFGVGGHYGSFLTTAPKAQYVKDSYTYFGEAYFQKNTAENQPWGAGIFYGNSGSRQYIGNMGGAFTYFQLPLLQSVRYASSLRLAAGVGCIEKPYNKNTNHKNVLIGSHINGYINLMWQNEVKILKNLSANAGVSFSHLSNGATTLPNLGLNIAALSVGLRYAEDVHYKQVNQTEITGSNKFYYQVSTSVGVKQIPWIGSPRYVVNVASIEAIKNLRGKNNLGGGVLLFYNRSLEVDPTIITGEKRNTSKTQAAVYALYERKMGRVSVPLQVGVMVYNKDINPVLFQQVGIRYYPMQNWYAQLQLKSYGGRADLLHAGIGHTFK